MVESGATNDARINAMAMVRMLLTERVVAFHPVIAQITKDVKAALFLCQLMYWSDKGDDTRGWIWKTRDQWTEETTMTRREQESARYKLKKLDIIEEYLGGSPPRIHYRVKWDTLYELMLDRADRYKTAHSIGTKPPIEEGGNEPIEGAESAPSIKEAEITTETTSETTQIFTDIDFPWLGVLRTITGWKKRGEPLVTPLVAWAAEKGYSPEYLNDHAIGVSQQGAKNLKDTASLSRKFQNACNAGYYARRNGKGPTTTTDDQQLERIRKAKNA
jgi:hypothetical protein